MAAAAKKAQSAPAKGKQGKPAQATAAQTKGKRPKVASSMPPRKGRGALATVAALLIASAIVRVGVGAGEAFAKAAGEEEASVAMVDGQGEDHAMGHEAEMMHQETDGSEMAMAAAAPLVTDPGEIGPLLASLAARESRVRQREAAIARRMQALNLAEEEITRKLEALEQAEEELRATLSLASTAAEDDLTRLTSVYSSMKPKNAAALFEEMAPEFAAGFLARMRPDSAAAIMAGLSPTVAYTISVILAGRNANVPKP